MQAAKVYRLGDLVTWSSQAAGSWSTKTGEVVEIVSANMTPTYHDGVSRPWAFSLGRRAVSYVVKVVEMGKRGPKKARVYWPITSKLSKAKARKK